MNKPTFTPGPWRVAAYGISSEHGYVKYCSPWIADAWVGDIDATANMTMMAAAPDLYKAAGHAFAVLMRSLESGNFVGDDEYDAMRVLDAAIAKAEGRS